MRVLFVAMANSIHTVRWIDQLAETGWDLHLFSFNDDEPHPDLRGVTVHRLLRKRGGSGRQVGMVWPLRRGRDRAQSHLVRLPALRDAERLARLIRRLRPDVVHSLEMQRCGYVTLAARRKLDRFPLWAYSSWGSDLYHFSQRPEHLDRIREVLRGCQFLIADCERDVGLARQLGFTGCTLGVVPVGGGFDLSAARQACPPAPPSKRRVVAIKGYHNYEYGGRGLIALDALERCARDLREYSIRVYSADQEVKRAAELLARSTALKIRVVTGCSHIEMLRLFGSSRVAIALGVTDGTPNSMLEAMIMGAFPIQSDTVSTREWIDGNNGLLVPPEDPEAVAEAIRKALGDDDLVDSAAVMNEAIADERLAREHVKSQVLDMYQKIQSRVSAATEGLPQ